MMFRQKIIPYAAVLAVGAIAGAAVARVGYPELEILYQGSETVLKQDFDYPEGKPEVTSAIITMKAGDQTGLHFHEVPLLAHVLEGRLQVDYGKNGRRVFGKGDTIVEAINTPHNGRVLGPEDLRLFVVYMGSDSARNSVPVDQE